MKNCCGMNLFDSKKGQAANHIAIVIFLFIFGFLSILGYLLMDEFITAFTATGEYTGVVETTGNNILAAMQMYDYIIVIVMVLLIVALALSNFRLRTHPAFFIITIIEAIFTGVVSYFFNYIFIQIVSDSVFDAIRVFFPRTMLICTNLHWIALVAIVVGSISLYAKKTDGVEFANQ